MAWADTSCLRCRSPRGHPGPRSAPAQVASSRLRAQARHGHGHGHGGHGANPGPGAPGPLSQMPTAAAWAHGPARAAPAMMAQARACRPRAHGGTPRSGPSRASVHTASTARNPPTQAMLGQMWLPEECRHAITAAAWSRTGASDSHHAGHGARRSRADALGERLSPHPAHVPDLAGDFGMLLKIDNASWSMLEDQNPQGQG